MEKVRGLLAVLILLGSVASARAAVILQIDSGILTGATGVSVGGTLYDVEFMDGTCGDLFSGCDEASDFVFQTAAGADAASNALLDQVLLDVADGNFDSMPWLTSGCERSQNLCLLFTVAGAGQSGFFASSAAYNEVGIDYPADRVSPGGVGAASSTVEPGTGPIQSAATFAIWRLASTGPGPDPEDPQDPATVPEPGTLALLSLGLAGLAALRRRRQ